MIVLNKPKFYVQLRRANKIILYLTVGLFTLIFVISLSVNYSITTSLSRLRLPNGYYYRDFSPPSPRIEFSVGLQNNGISRVSNFNLYISLDISYFNITDLSHHRHNIFKKQQNFGSIAPLSGINATFIGEDAYFDCSYLEHIFNHSDTMVDIYFLINITFSYRYFFGTIPVDLSFKNLDLAIIECPTCML